MHKTRFNALQLHLAIRPRGPLLIKAGGLSANPALPDMQFVRTYHPHLGETVYLPGSSVKGAIRAFCEKVLRTIDKRDSWQWACSTFPSEIESCSKKLEGLRDSAQIYCRSCGSCRLFGHTRLRGRVCCSDFFPTSSLGTEVRYGVAISRLSQAVAQGPFELEAVVAGVFSGQIIIENYELWQLGVLCLALQSMNQGLLKLGFGKNRGFGDVAVEVRQAIIDEAVQLRGHPALTVLRGLGAFVPAEDQARYGLFLPHHLDGLPVPAHIEELGPYWRRMYDAGSWPACVQQIMSAITSA
jgi:CRISPR-associated protein Csm3